MLTCKDSEIKHLISVFLVTSKMKCLLMLNNRNLAHYKESPVVIFEHLNWIFTFPTTHLEDLFTFSVMHMCRFNYCTFVMFLANLATGR